MDSKVLIIVVNNKRVMDKTLSVSIVIRLKDMVVVGRNYCCIDMRLESLNQTIYA